MTDAQQRYLKALRQAAHARDPEQVQFQTKQLLISLEYYYALAVVIEAVRDFLEIFESYYPEETWVRRLLLMMTSYGTAPDDSVAEIALSREFEAPGCGNYLKAVYDLTQAMQSKHGGESRIGYMTSAIQNAIMAELVEAYYGEREGDWQTVRQAQRSDPGGALHQEAAAIAYAFWTDDETAALDTALWLQIAGRIERTLTR